MSEWERVWKSGSSKRAIRCVYVMSLQLCDKFSNSVKAKMLIGICTTFRARCSVVLALIWIWRYMSSEHTRLCLSIDLCVMIRNEKKISIDKRILSTRPLQNTWTSHYGCHCHVRFDHHPRRDHNSISSFQIWKQKWKWSGKQNVYEKMSKKWSIISAESKRKQFSAATVMREKKR